MNIRFLENKYLRNLLITTFLVASFSNILLAQEIPITTDSRIKTLVYNANEVYQLKFHYGYQSFIEFDEDETIEMISIGESFAWRLTPTGRRLFVRPLEIAAHTNMTIITNKRTYQFDIRSGEYDGKADEELVYVVRFFYPNLRIQKPIPSQLSKPNPAGQNPQTPPAGFTASGGVIRTPSPTADLSDDLEGALALNNAGNVLNFDYQFAGAAPDITPIKVYDNGQETSFQFKNNNLIIPTINTVDIFGNEVPTAYVIKDNYIVVPTISSQYTLRLADSLLCVFNNKMIRSH